MYVTRIISNKYKTLNTKSKTICLGFKWFIIFLFRMFCKIKQNTYHVKVG